MGHNSWDRLSSGGYGSVYARTATTMRDLEERLTTPVMEKAFKTYYNTWKFRHPSIADFKAILSEVSGKPEVVEQVFAQQVYATTRVDDRIDKFTSVEELPQPGSSGAKGLWTEDTQDMIDKRVSEQRKAWKKANPDAKEGTGPFPYRTTITLRRRGAQVPQTLVVKFADGSAETVQWNADTNWQRYSWVKSSKAVSAELDPARMHFLDASKVDDSRALKPERSASSRWGTQLAALFQALFSLIATV